MMEPIAMHSGARTPHGQLWGYRSSRVHWARLQPPWRGEAEISDLWAELGRALAWPCGQHRVGADMPTAVG